MGSTTIMERFKGRKESVIEWVCLNHQIFRPSTACVTGKPGYTWECVVYFHCQDGEQCTGRRDEVNPCADTEDFDSRTMAAASCNIAVIIVSIRT